MTTKLKLTKQLFLTLLISSFTSQANITGTIYRDFNSDGLQTASTGIGVGDPGITNITITAFDSFNTQSGTTVSLTDGSYSLVTTGVGPYRVEFSNIPSYLQSGETGANSNTSVQFVTDGNASNVDLGLNNPADYYNDGNPLIAMPYHQSGLVSADNTLAIGSVLYDSTELNLNFQHFPFNAGAEQGLGPVPNQDANRNEIGSVWGVAWQSEQKRLFAGTFLKRHSQMAKGPGYIYILDYSTTPATVATDFDLQNVMPANGGVAIDLGSVCRRNTTDGDANLTCDPQVTGLATDYELSLPTARSIDIDAFGKIATMSFGDLDMQEDAPVLWIVNLFQKALISVDASGSMPGVTNQYLLEGLNGWPTCATGELRPWALKFNDGKGYLGVVCDASVSQDRDDLHAYVLSFDPNNIASGLTSELDFALNYPRDIADAPEVTFNPWLNTFAAPPVVIQGQFDRYAQPILSDFEFDSQGNLYLNIMDRFGHQYAPRQPRALSGDVANQLTLVGGDILKVCNVNGSWSLEGSADCSVAYRPTIATDTFDVGPLGGGEYFENRAGDGFQENSEGAFAILKGNGEIVTTAMDPHPTGVVDSRYFFIQGIETHDLTTGAVSNWYGIGAGASFPQLGKTGGIGDIELLTAPAPLEIDNYVWLDLNFNGIQDPNEPVINNVTVTIHDMDNGGLQVGSATTTNGVYYFGGDTDANMTSGSLLINTNYEIRIDLTDASLPAGIVGLTIQNANGVIDNDSKTDLADNDALQVANMAVIAYATGLSGENNHTLDFGFILTSVSLGSVIWHDADNSGTQDINEVGIAGAIVILLDGMGNPVAGVMPQITGADGTYFFDNLLEGDYQVQVDMSNTVGFIPSSAQVTNPDDNVAGDSNIATTMGLVYTSGTVSLSNNSEPSGMVEVSPLLINGDSADSADDDNGNMTVDFGFYQAVSLGSVIWNDLDDINLAE